MDCQLQVPLMDMSSKDPAPPIDGGYLVLYRTMYMCMFWIGSDVFLKYFGTLERGVCLYD